jgi:hypothetical protein
MGTALGTQLGSMKMLCEHNTRIFLKIFENIDVICKMMH